MAQNSWDEVYEELDTIHKCQFAVIIDKIKSLEYRLQKLEEEMYEEVEFTSANIPRGDYK